MRSLNRFQTFAHCWRFAIRRASVDGDTFHVVTTGDALMPRRVLSDRKLFSREDFRPQSIEASADPFLVGTANAVES